jgi:hypothetical protein
MDAAANEDLRARQRDAIWKWRWLGLRDSTPGFKGAMVLLALAAVGLAGYAAMALRF